MRSTPWVAACAALTAFAYRRLLSFEPERSLPEELETWFFVPSESTTPVVVGLALWLLFRRADRLRALAPGMASAWPGAFGLVFGLGLHAWAIYTNASDLLLPSLACVALGCAWLWRGAAAVRVVWLPVAFLVFAMPLPAPLRNEVVYQLQLWTAEIAGWVLYFGGVPHFVAAEQVFRPEATFSVIESCSGMRSMETLSIVAVLMMDLFRRRGLHALLVVVAAPAVAFGLNGLRAVALILNPYSELASIHAAQGIAMLLAGLMLLWLLDGLLERLRVPADLPAPPGARRVVAARPGLRALAVGSVLVCACLASLALPVWELERTPPGSMRPWLDEALGDSEDLGLDRSFLGTTLFVEAVHQRYVRPGGDPILFVAVGARANR
ncbi:MAG: exosortase/archaeosortase family protein, partial [Deltaproteobacteria bacterium]|nr:exosortase/archaeosortase family protein [Deltaproteobacteria bacterium]